MPSGQTWSFNSCDQLISYLRAREWKQDFKKAHDRIKDFGPLTAIYHSVGSSTFRAFRIGGHSTPSEVFRAWAGRKIAESGLSELLAVKSSEDYREWAVYSAKSLAREWKHKLGYQLEIPRALKLVNLLAKGLCIVAPLWPEQYETTVWNVDVPLDKFTLRPLACIPELAKIGMEG